MEVKMKFKILFVIAIVLLARSSFAQQNVLDGVFVKEHTQTRDPLVYPYLREADVMWSKRVWRVIDLNEKLNLPFRHPIAKTDDRMSLIDLLFDKIKEGSLTAFSADDDEFTLPVTFDKITAKGGARTDTVKMNRPDPPYDEYDTVIKKEFSSEKVIAYRVKEDWFFDKQRSVMDVRIIGIAPMIYDVDETGTIRPGNTKKPLFWIYYPEARSILAHQEAFNRQNDAERRSFEDLFEKRLFSSYIYKESNVYDRRIEDYVIGLHALLEAEKIKTEITNFEHDMWEY